MEEFERLKAICEKEGFELLNETLEDNEKFFVVKKKKDEWERVEFVEVIQDATHVKKGQIFKVLGVNKGIGFLPPYYKLTNGNSLHASRDILKPSSEAAYVEQLKKEAFERHSNRLESSKIDDSMMDGGIIYYGYNSEDEPFKYRKDTDTLYWCGIPIYQSGKWATRVKERVEVEYEMASTSGNNYLNLSYKVSRDIKGKEIAEIALFLASQLEKYLNGEIK